MKRIWWSIPVVLLALMFAGCGGGGGGNGGDGDDDGDIDLNCSLIGTWLPVTALEDDAPVKVSDAMWAWDPDWTSAELTFLANGTCSIRGFEGTTADSAVVQGTWMSDQGIAQISIGGENIVLNWGDMGYVMHTAQFNRNSHEYKTQWVRIANLTERDQNMVRTWRVDSVVVNGTTRTAAQYYGMPSDSHMTYQFHANGNLIRRQVNVEGIVSLPKTQGTWTTGGGQLKMALGGSEVRCIQHTRTFMNAQGETVSLNWGEWAPGLAPGQTRPTALLGVWRAQSATMNGTPIPLADFFEFEAGVNRFEIQFWADGTLEQSDYAGTTLVSSELGVWYTTGNVLTLQLGDLIQATYSISGSTLTATLVEGADTFVLTFTKIQ